MGTGVNQEDRRGFWILVSTTASCALIAIVTAVVLSRSFQDLSLPIAIVLLLLCVICGAIVVFMAVVVVDAFSKSRRLDLPIILEESARYLADNDPEHAEQALRRALAAYERAYPRDATKLLGPLSALGSFLADRGELAEAESLSARALRIARTSYPAEHPMVFGTTLNLATVYVDERKFAEAEPLARSAVKTVERYLGHPFTSLDLFNALARLAWTCVGMEKDSEADACRDRLFALLPELRREDHATAERALQNLANGCSRSGQYLLQLRIEEEILELRAIGVSASYLNRLISIGVDALHLQRYEDAEVLCRRALEIAERLVGPEHPDVVLCLSNLAVLHLEQGRFAESEALCQRGLALAEARLDPKSAELGAILRTHASLLAVQGKAAEAEPIHRRSLSILEAALGTKGATFGPKHEQLAISLVRLAECCAAQERNEEAEALCRQALGMFEKRDTLRHPIAIWVSGLLARVTARAPV
jgi:tetratricopeptide (TPR) repeat protein